MKNHGKPPRGVAEYQRTLRQGGDPVPPAPPLPPEPGVPQEGLLKTRSPIPRRLPGVPPAGEDSRRRRVAKFLILIGGEEAARILSALDPEQVELIAGEIASIRGVSPEEAEDVFKEFRSLLGSPRGYAGTAAGGRDAARRMLYAAFGPERGESILVRAVPEARKNPFDFLEDLSGEETFLLLRDESPSTAALVLSRLSPGVSAASLARFPREQKFDIVRRIARLGQSSPEVLETVAAALREKARHISAAAGKAAFEVDGKKALAAILKNADYSFGGRILEELEDRDPDLGRDMKERLHTLEDVVKAEDRPLQEKFRTMTNRDLVLLLKDRPPGFTEKILSNVSANRRAMLREEADLAGPVPKRDTDAAVRDFMAWFRLNREEGRIILNDDGDVIL